MQPTVRPVKASDLATVHRIELDSYPDPWPRSIFYLMRDRAPDLFLVAEAEDAIISYVIGEIEWREGARVGHIMNIAVVEKWRRKGLANKMLDEIEHRFADRRVEFSYLEVRAGNTPAQSLYRKRGYAEVGRLPGYYRDEDGLAMEKPLP